MLGLTLFMELSLPVSDSVCVSYDTWPTQILYLSPMGKGWGPSFYNTRGLCPHDCHWEGPHGMVDCNPRLKLISLCLFPMRVKHRSIQCLTVLCFHSWLHYQDTVGRVFRLLLLLIGKRCLWHDYYAMAKMEIKRLTKLLQRKNCKKIKNLKKILKILWFLNYMDSQILWYYIKKCWYGNESRSRQAYVNKLSNRVIYHIFLCKISIFSRHREGMFIQINFEINTETGSFSQWNMKVLYSTQSFK